MGPHIVQVPANNLIVAGYLRSAICSEVWFTYYKTYIEQMVISKAIRVSKDRCW